jgi:hypothetical protein
MKSLKLTAIDASSRVFSMLEKRRLIRVLRPDKKFTASNSVDVVYTSAPEYGSHKLICVRPDSAQVALNSHPDNEEFILIDSDRAPRKPLYMLIGLHGHDVIESKAREGSLDSGDFLLLKLAFNRPSTCVFTMLAGTPHCELVFPGKARPPVFFVAEPSMLSMRFVKLNGYSFGFSRGR